MNKVAKISILIAIFFLCLYNACFADLIIPSNISTEDLEPVEPVYNTTSSPVEEPTPEPEVPVVEVSQPNYALITIVVVVIIVCIAVIAIKSSNKS